MRKSRNTISRFGRRKIKDIGFPVREAVLYARVSTPDQQREGYSIPAQIKLLEDYAALSGIEIASRHIDVETARKAGRTAFGEMIRYLRKHPHIRILLVEKTDRLYRNLKDWAIIDELGVEVHFVKENAVMSGNCRSSEKFVHGIKVLMAKAYIDNLSEETRKGMVEKAQQGIWPSFAPLGYRNVTDPSGRKVITVDPEFGPLVRRLFDWFSTGNYSLKAITSKVRIAGLRYRKTGKPVSVTTVHHMLRNRIYTGSFDWLGVTYAGSHEPLTTPALWQVVQNVLDGRGQDNTHSRVEDFSYRGLIKCGHCGCALVAEIKKGRYIYYHCTGFRGKCPEPYVRQERLEEHFVELLRGLHCSAPSFAQLRDAIEKGVEASYPVTPLSAHRPKAERAGQVGALFQDGIALLDMARTAHFGWTALCAELKRQILQLLLASCSWANGRLTARFNAPFDKLASYSQRLEGEGRECATGQLFCPPEAERLSEILLQPSQETKQLIARYNAMLRIQAEEGVTMPDESEDWSEFEVLAA